MVKKNEIAKVSNTTVSKRSEDEPSFFKGVVSLFVFGLSLIKVKNLKMQAGGQKFDLDANIEFADKPYAVRITEGK